MTTEDKDFDRLLSKLLNTALIPTGFRPTTNSSIEAMLETVGGKPLSGDKLARMLHKVRGEEPLGRSREQERPKVTPTILNETQQELLMLYRSKGKSIPPEIQAMLDDMRKRAAELNGEQKDES